jgi:hypothetical protein
MNPVWSSGLPQDQFLELSDHRQAGFVRTQTETGPAKKRLRFTAVARAVQMALTLTGAQRAIFDSFWIATLKEGSLPFDWKDPVGDSTVTFSFVSPPTWSLLVGNADPDKRVWQATLDLEILP